MSKYIKLEDAISEADRLLGMVPDTDFDDGIEHGIETMKFVLADLPTIDVCEDAISRATALEIYSDLYWMDERLLNFKDELNKVYDDLRNAPSVIPQQKEGEWIRQGISPHEGIQICSLCGAMYDITAEFDNCPNCHAKMKGVYDEE